MRCARTAMEDDDRRLSCLQVAGHPEPGHVTAEFGVAFADVHTAHCPFVLPHSARRWLDKLFIAARARLSAGPVVLPRARLSAFGPGRSTALPARGSQRCDSPSQELSTAYLCLPSSDIAQIPWYISLMSERFAQTLVHLGLLLALLWPCAGFAQDEADR